MNKDMFKRLQGLSARGTAYYLPLLLLFMLSSCLVSSMDNEEDIPGGQRPESDVVEATFSIKTPAVPSSYAIAEEDENFIKEIQVLVFRKEDGTGRLLFAYSTEGVITTENNTTKEFTATLKKDLDNEYIFVILANSKGAINSMGGIAQNALKEKALPRIITRISDKWTASSSQNFTPIPMWGETTTPCSISENMSFTDLKLVRSVARVDIGSNLPASFFELKEIYVYNWKNRGRIIPDTDPDNWDATNHRALKPSIPDDDSLDPINETDPLVYSVPSGNKLQREIYLHEAEAVADGDDLDATCIVVGGNYNNSSRTTYYRIDFTESGSFRHILRNHLYNFGITNVLEEGYFTPDSAFRYKKTKLEVDITTWNMMDMKEVTIEGAFNLSVSTGRFDFTNTVSSGRLYVTSNNPKGWYVSGISNSRISVNKTATGDAVDVSVSGTTSLSNGFFYIISGNLTKKIIVNKY